MERMTQLMDRSGQELQEAQEAMEWLYRLEHADRQERSIFLLWLLQSPQHVREFLLAATWDLMLCELDTVVRLSTVDC
jgi:ferric-dicitrate binding protein FerR (iron transport regulator)